eukprot:TRINITY_DN38235_c0_g1_i1.p1 TRINITY_DN38235_c0_g1~~TRINITY_DN38235_c0_g1_i1.p1  ORF type:complete len:544 (+),score=74.05 TRINITY_DN38235_c0_g1_i1:90-1634(+)
MSSAASLASRPVRYGTSSDFRQRMRSSFRDFADLEPAARRSSMLSLDADVSASILIAATRLDMGPDRLSSAERVDQMSRTLSVSKGMKAISWATIVFTVVLDYVGTTMLDPIAPKLVALYTLPGWISPASAAAGISYLYTLGQLVGQPIAGIVSDKMGRKPVFLALLLGTGVSFLMAGLSQSYIEVCVWRFVAGLCGASRGVAQAYAGDMCSPEEVSGYVSMVGVAVALGCIIAPVIGGLLGNVSVIAPLFLVAGLSFFNLILAIFVMINPPVLARGLATDGEESKDRKTPWALISVLCLSGFLYFWVSSTIEVITPLQALQTMQMTTTEVGIMFGAGGLVVCLAQVFVYQPLEKRLPNWALQIFGFSLSVPLVLVSAVKAKWFLWFSVILSFATVSMVNVAQCVFMTELSPPHMRGALAMLLNEFQTLGFTVGGLVSGWLFGSSWRLPFVVTGVVIAMAMALSGVTGAIVLHTLRDETESEIDTETGADDDESDGDSESEPGGLTPSPAEQRS